MKISNIRLGFATNSSSVHSIVNPARLKDDYNAQEFGWDEFCLASKSAKQEYLAQTIYQHLQYAIGSELSKVVTVDLAGAIPDPEGYVDHQSLMDLPVSPKTRQVSVPFFSELRDRYLQPDIAIVGGNDNSYFCKFPESMRKKHLIPVDSGKHFCRKDGDWWVLMNKFTGTKIRLSFNDSTYPYLKSTSPELVDVSITDMCLKDCRYCYRSSHEHGQHADYGFLSQLIYRLEKTGVFEVCLGGGEPTLHPYFSSLVEQAHSEGLLVSFSTRDLSWVDNSRIVGAVKKCVTRFGVSIDHSSEIGTAKRMIPGELYDKVYYHYIVGRGYLDGVMKEIDRPLVLLGPKRTGRGIKCPLLDNKEDWIKLTKNEWQTTIGIDTVLAQQYREQVKKEYNPLLVQYDEGKFSMFVDAVKQEAGKCSYTSEMTSVKDFRPEDYLKLFASY